jgi:hypothetical protein
MTLHDFSIDIAPTVQAVAACLSLISIVFLWYQIKKTNDWNRTGAAFSIMNLAEFYRLEEIATRECKKIDVPFPSVLTLEVVAKVRNSYDAYHAVKNLVIFVDRLCVAYQAGYADKDVIAFTFGPLIVGYHKILVNYIVFTRQELNAPEIYRDFAHAASDVNARIEKCRRKLRDKEVGGNGHGGIGPRV